MNTDNFTAANWPHAIYNTFKQKEIAIVSYVPDAGLAALINYCQADPKMTTIPLTTEEEGIPLAAGAYLGGKRAALLMQSSGVGNCVNMFSLAAVGSFPLFMLVSMRGEWGEFNPWQVPMGHATEAALSAIGVTVLRAEAAADVVDMVEQAAGMAFEGDQQIAVLLGQRLLGKKKW